MHGIPPSSGRVAPCVQGIRSDVEKGLVHQDTAESHRTGSMWFQNVFFKQEPAEYDRDDSGINSGNEFQASSPEGDGSQDGNTQDTLMQLNVQLGIDRLKMIQKQSQPNSLPAMESGQAEDILRNLREAMELSRMLTQIPDEVKGTDMEKDNKRANEKISKKKTKSCKTCGFVPEDEDQYYRHIETHMRPSKVLRCHFCKFVTEFKHHLEYHLCQHSGKKQFKCEECGYECINKSMLSSHLKSHSRIYQYHCADCTYSTKYQHALKEHLKKYTHKPALVLNPDGTPNPLIIIDVYGKRRGPKLKQMPIRQEEPSSNLPLSPLLLNNQQFAQTQQQQTPNQRSTLFQPPLMPQHLLLPFMFPNGQPFPLTTAFPLMGDIHKAYATSLMITQALHQQMQAQSPQSQPASSPIPSSHSRAVSPWGFDTDVEPSSPISDAGSEVLDLTVKRPKN